MTKYFLFVALAGILLTGNTGFAQVHDPRLKGIDTLVVRILQEWKAPGCAIAVVEKQKVLFAGGFGYRDLEKKTPVTGSTLYAIGSSTKAFTCALMGILADENKLDLDQPAIRYLPALRFSDPLLTAQVTPRDMMCHRTGLPRHDIAWYATSISSDSLVKRIEHFEKTAELRTRFQYNNFMLMALGSLAQVVEKGKPFVQQLSERFFVPLGMTHTKITTAEVMKTDDRALPYVTVNDSFTINIPFRNIGNMAPAGGINSCAKDISAWLITWINGGTYGGNTIIPASFYSQAISTQMGNVSLPNPGSPDVFFNDYGLGWFLSSYRGHYRVEHGGDIDGFTATVGFFPADSLGIAVFVNQGGSSVNTIIRNIIADRLLGLPYKDWNASLRKERLTVREAGKARLKGDTTGQGFPPSHPLNDYCGKYVNPGYGSVEIRQQGDSLTGNFGPVKIWMKHKNYDAFEACGYERESDLKYNLVSRFNAVFRINNHGEIAELALNLEPAANDIIFTKEITATEMKPEELTKYEGEYVIGDVTAKIYIKSEKILCLFIPGQPEYELVPVKKHEFVPKLLKDYGLVFIEGEKGTIVAVVFRQPEGNFRAEKKK